MKKYILATMTLGLLALSFLMDLMTSMPSQVAEKENLAPTTIAGNGTGTCVGHGGS